MSSLAYATIARGHCSCSRMKWITCTRSLPCDDWRGLRARKTRLRKVLNKSIRAWKSDMKEIWLLTVEHAVQVGEDVLIVPFLATDKYRFNLQSIERIKIVKPDNQIIEKDANFGIPFDADVYILLIPNTQKDEIPIDSQIWIESFQRELFFVQI